MGRHGTCTRGSKHLSKDWQPCHQPVSCPANAPTPAAAAPVLRYSAGKHGNKCMLPISFWTLWQHSSCVATDVYDGCKCHTLLICVSQVLQAGLCQCGQAPTVASACPQSTGLCHHFRGPWGRSQGHGGCSSAKAQHWVAAA
jgi:hypothetical protein